MSNNPIIDSYLTHIQEVWQGLSGKIDWPAVARDVADSTHRLVEKQRLPAEHINWSDPAKWTRREIQAIAAWSRQQQMLLDNGDLNMYPTAFQWREYEDHTTFRDTIHPDSALKYSEAAAAYMSAMTRLKFQPHVYLLIDSTSRPSMFSAEAQTLLRELSILESLLIPMMKLIDVLESTEAPIVSE